MSGQSALVYALEYRLRGWRPIPVPLRSKNPGREGWQDERLDEPEIRQRFAQPCNVSVLLGEPSGGLTDIDLDCEETRGLAQIFLPPSKTIFGRPGNPGSHVLYRVRGELATRRFQDSVKRDADDDARNTLVEIRSTGAHTVFPGSLHPSGEEIAWVYDETPPHVDANELATTVSRLAAAALLARHWPGQGSRQDTAMALAGTLLRGGWSQTEAAGFISAVAMAAHDEEHAKRGEPLWRIALWIGPWSGSASGCMRKMRTKALARSRRRTNWWRSALRVSCLRTPTRTRWP